MVFLLCVSAAFGSLNPQFTSAQAEDIPFKLTFSENELQFGVTLAHFIMELNANKFIKSDLTTMLETHKKAPAFLEFKNT